MSKERDALVKAFVTLAAIKSNSIGPAMASMATDAAAACLWALGVEEHSGIKAKRPDGAVIDLSPTRSIGRAKQ